MARGKKKQKGKGGAPSSPTSDEDAVVLPAAPKSLQKPFADALRGLTVEKPKAKPAPPGGEPSVRRASKPKAARDAAARGAETAGPAAYSYEDRVAFNQAFSGVSPLGGKGGARRQPARQSAPPRDRSATAPEPGGVDTDAVARARLDALVGGGVRFDVRRDAGWVEGERAGKNGRALRDLRQGRATPEAEIDLHRMTGDEAEHALVHFLRDEAKRGRRVVRVIHGKGLHSEGGIGVLGDRVVDAITGGSAAVHVAAFVTASMSHGGAGALLVRLVER